MGNKTHILWNPNKNYLGSWDLPEKGDLILTIKSCQWEDVKNPTNGETKSKRVIHFEEDVKPMICNEENAMAIHKAHKIDFIEDLKGKGLKIGIYGLNGRWFGEEREALRIRDKAPKKVKEKDVLTETHEKYEKLCKNIKQGKFDPDNASKFFVVSDEMQKKLNKLRPK